MVWPIYKRLLVFVQPYLGQLFAAVFFMAVLSMTTMMYAFLSGPLVAAMITGGKEGLGTFAKLFPFLGETFEKMPSTALTTWVPIILVVVAAIKGTAFLGQHYLVRGLGQTVIVDLRNVLFAKVLRLPSAYFNDNTTGDLMSRFTADVTQVETSVTEALADLVRNGLMVIGLVAQCFFLDYELAFIAFCLVPLTAIPVGQFMKYLRKQARAGQDSLGYSGTMLAEVLGGMRIVQVFQREKYEQEKYEVEGARYLKIMKRAIFARGVYSPIMEIAGVVGFALLLVYATERIANGDLEAAFLLSFMTTVLMVYQPVKQIGRVSNQILVGVAAAERIFEVIDAEEAISDVAAAETKETLEKGIRFNNLHFAYPEREETLMAINLEIPKGQVVALVGASGAGKSTMAALVPRFSDPQKGEVLFDEKDIRELKLSSVRKLVSVVTQDTILFSGTIRDNIAYARPDAPDEDIFAAAKAAYCADFIAEQPEGYQTRIGERGVRLSGGQRQRLCVARAILAGAPILVLDEATSALDTESERMVQRALDNLMQGRTSLVIAHRLSTILHADQIIVMNAGRIVERGSHEELLEKEGEYARLYHMQFHK